MGSDHQTSAENAAGELQATSREVDRRILLCRDHLKSASRTLAYRRIRYLAAKVALPGWVAALIAGSTAAIFMACAAVIVGLGYAIILFTLIALGYAIVGGGVWALLWDEPESNQQTRRSIRLDLLSKAVAYRDSLGDQLAELEHLATSTRLELAELAASASSKKNALLAVEVGRLYFDELERFVADVFASLGYAVEVTGKTGDQGVDVIAQKDGRRVAIQVKCYSGSVGNAAVQEVFAGMMHRKCHCCCVVTNNYFTSSARELARSTSCTLIDRDGIAALIAGNIIL